MKNLTVCVRPQQERQKRPARTTGKDEPRKGEKEGEEEMEHKQQPQGSKVVHTSAQSTPSRKLHPHFTYTVMLLEGEKPDRCDVQQQPQLDNNNDTTTSTTTKSTTTSTTMTPT